MKLLVPIVCVVVWCWNSFGLAQAKRAAPTAPAGDSAAEELFDPTATPTPASAAPVSEPGYLGAILDDRQETNGVRVVHVVPSGPADRGGLRVGDLIHEAGGKTIRGMDDLGRVLSRAAVGSRLKFEVERETAAENFGEMISLEVTLATRPPANERPYPQFGRIEEGLAETPLAEQPLLLMLGVRTVQLDRAWRTQLNVPVGRGALVTSVERDSAADKAGIKPRMVIAAVNNRAIASPEDLTERLSMSDPARPVELAIYAGPDLHRIKITLPRFPTDGSTAVAKTQDPPPVNPEIEDDRDNVPSPSDTRIEALEKRIRQLQEQVELLELRLESLETAAQKSAK